MSSPVTDAHIAAVVERSLHGRKVEEVVRRPSRYATSHVLEELVVRLDDGSAVDLVRKEVGEGALLPEAEAMRARVIHEFTDIGVEGTVYERVLPETPRCRAPQWVGTGEGPDPGQRWLLLEHVGGVELYQVGDVDRWCTAALSIGQMHTDLSALLPAMSGAFPRRTASWYEQWLRRAAHPALERITAKYSEIADRVASLPPTIVHGDLYASNVLVDDTGRVCPVDWERAAVATGWLDLASLVAGWTDDAVIDRLTDAYVSGLSAALLEGVDARADLDRCRLLVAVQWLGWAPGWDAPAEHATDWLTEALNAAERLGL